MFTGIVRDLGRVVQVQKSAQACTLSIETSLAWEHLQIGASVACNGICLTVTSAKQSSSPQKFQFTVDAGFETLTCTQLSHVDVGTLLNLEPALRFGDAMGGHQVSGHVDVSLRVSSVIVHDSGFRELKLSVPLHYKQYVFNKGSIAVRGVSLTLANVAEQKDAVEISIMLIPETLQKTNLGNLAEGDRVEVEFDPVVKSIARVVETMLPSFLNK